MPHTFVAADAPPAHRLFWAWYAAGVDTVRCALEVQSVLVRQMIEVSPVSLALQFPFSPAYQASNNDHGRALA